MIKSVCSKLILPLALSTIISGGMLAKTVIEKETDNKELIYGSLLGLGILGTAGCAKRIRDVNKLNRIEAEKERERFYSERIDSICDSISSGKSKDDIKVDIYDLRRKMFHMGAAAGFNSIILEIFRAMDSGFSKDDEELKLRLKYWVLRANSKEKAHQYQEQHPEVDFKKAYVFNAETHSFETKKEMSLLKDTNDMRAELLRMLSRSLLPDNNDGEHVRELINKAYMEVLQGRNLDEASINHLICEYNKLFN